MMKTKRFWFGLIASALLLSILACQVAYNVGSGPISIGGRTVRGSGTLATEERTVSGFNAVDLASIGDLVIEVGDQETLRIEAEENLLEYIETDVRDHTLEISSRRGINLNPTKSISFYLTVVSLDSITVSGLGSVEAPGLEADEFSVEISGSGDVSIDSLTASRLRVDISGLGNLDIEAGQVDGQEIGISGAGDFNASDLESSTAEVDISGLGSATLQVSDRLEASISGGGSVRYYGDPSVDKNVSGLGRIEQLGK